MVWIVGQDPATFPILTDHLCVYYTVTLKGVWANIAIRKQTMLCQFADVLNKGGSKSF